MSEQGEHTHQSLTRSELLRRQIATSSFVGLDPLHYSCDSPIPVAPRQDCEVVQDNSNNTDGGYAIHIDRVTGDMTVTQLDKTEQGGTHE